jgi:serine acetyltransferase
MLITSNFCWLVYLYVIMRSCFRLFVNKHLLRHSHRWNAKLSLTVHKFCRLDQALYFKHHLMIMKAKTRE